MYLVFDTETTGLPTNFQAPLSDSTNWPRIVELAWGVYDENGQRFSAGQLLVKPEGFAIPPQATQIHGITTEQAASEGIDLSDALGQLIAAADGCQYLVAHNIEYDLAIVGAELHRLSRTGFKESLRPVCTMRMGTGFDKGPGGRGAKPPKLHELHEALFDEEIEGAHRADVDVAACARCLFALLDRGVDLPEMKVLVNPSAIRPKRAAMTLDLDNREFQLALDLIENTNRSIFLTGKAGTGKSTFLRHIVAHTRKKAIVVAPTGVAALNAGGTTIHSMFRLPFGIMQPNDNRVRYFGPNREGEFINEDKFKLLQAVELVIIDEVSMVRADILDAIDYTLRRNSRRSREPFGGKQVLLVGDAYQLPPVLTPADRQLYEPNYRTRYFFGAEVFTRLPLITVELRKAYRQQDPHFINLLDRVRTNQADNEDLRKLNGRTQDNSPAAGRKITLSTRNKDAEDYNAGELSKLTNPLVKYMGVVTGDFAESDFPTARELVLKEGAQVMFVHNDRSGRWVNGTIGRVVKLDKKIAKVEIEDGATYTVEAVEWDKFAYGLDEVTGHIVSTIIGTFTQLPLKLAWALTVHKSQGLTFDAVEINAPTGFFDSGQLYVALSRCRSFEGLQLRTPVRMRDVMVSPEVVELHRTANDEQQVADALAEARPNKLYQKSLQLLDRSDLASAVAAFCEALGLRNDAQKPLFGRLLRHKLHGYVQAKQRLAGLSVAHDALLASNHVDAAMQVVKEAQEQAALADLKQELTAAKKQNAEDQKQHKALEATWQEERQQLQQQLVQANLEREAERQINTQLTAERQQEKALHAKQLSQKEHSTRVTLDGAYENLVRLQDKLTSANRQITMLKEELDQERALNRPWWQKLKDKL
jgi:DNA polymerase III epsilon subunit-like protein